MPDITAAGTYTKTSPGFESLAASARKRELLFAGTLATTQVKYIDDKGTAQDLPSGSITTDPTGLFVSTSAELQIVVSGSPDFNVSIRDAAE